MLRSHPRAAKFSLSLILGLIASFALASSALAVTVGPSGKTFYTPPKTLPAGGHGTLIWYRTGTLNFAGATPSATTDTVMYKSDSVGTTSDVVTGTVIVPTAAWTGTGPRPVVDFGVGTQGLAQISSPSEQLLAGTEYESANIGDLLNKGYTVEVTDYAGYTNGGVPDYIVGSSEGHAMLDIALAAQQLPNVSISPSAQMAIWGYSQGGGASAWASQLVPSYAPTLNFVGDASGGTPSNLDAVAQNLNTSSFAAFLLYAVIGLNQDYPTQIGLSKYVTSAGTKAIKSAEADTLIEAYGQFDNKNIDSYTVNDPATKSPWTLTELLAVPSINTVVQAQALGGVPITKPVYEYHASADNVVPLAQDQALNKTYCSEGVTDDFVEYPGDHITVDGTAASDVVTWIGNRFAGLPAPSNC